MPAQHQIRSFSVHLRFFLHSNYDGCFDILMYNGLELTRFGEAFICIECFQQQ